MYTRIYPSVVEYHLAHALGEVIGHWGDAWHILRAGDHMAALVLFRHHEIGLSHVYHLSHLMLDAFIPHGYLVCLAPVPPDVAYAALSIGIVLIDEPLAEVILTEILEGRWTQSP